jgi:GNAT superfamily N-acetyltransferase
MTTQVCRRSQSRIGIWVSLMDPEPERPSCGPKSGVHRMQPCAGEAFDPSGMTIAHAGVAPVPFVCSAAIPSSHSEYCNGCFQCILWLQAEQRNSMDAVGAFMTFTYRLAEGRDGRACAKIVWDWAAETPWLGPISDFERLAEWWGGCLRHVETSWVCEDDGTVVGFCVRQDDNITGLYVCRDARGCGVGKGLLDLAKVDREWITVWAYARNPRARQFYRREGCVEISREIEEETALVDVEHRWTRPR